MKRMFSNMINRKFSYVFFLILSYSLAAHSVLWAASEVGAVGRIQAGNGLIENDSGDATRSFTALNAAQVLLSGTVTNRSVRVAGEAASSARHGCLGATASGRRLLDLARHDPRVSRLAGRNLRRGSRLVRTGVRTTADANVFSDHEWLACSR